MGKLGCRKVRGLAQNMVANGLLRKNVYRMKSERLKVFTPSKKIFYEARLKSNSLHVFRTIKEVQHFCESYIRFNCAKPLQGITFKPGFLVPFFEGRKGLKNAPINK